MCCDPEREREREGGGGGGGRMERKEIGREGRRQGNKEKRTKL